MDDDTIAWTEDDVATLAAMLHTCTPRWWPHHIGEHWTCECGHGYHVEHYPAFGQLGWMSDA